MSTASVLSSRTVRVASSTTVLRTTQCPVASSRAVLARSVSAAVVGFFLRAGRFPWTGVALRCVASPGRRAGEALVGRSPSRCGLDIGRTGSFLPPNPRRNRGQQSGEEIGTAKWTDPAVLSLLFISCRGDETTGSETYSYGTGTVGGWVRVSPAPPPPPTPHDLERATGANVAALFDPEPGAVLVAPLTRPSFASFFCLLTVADCACRRRVR